MFMHTFATYDNKRYAKVQRTVVRDYSRRHKLGSPCAADTAPLPCPRRRCRRGPRSVSASWTLQSRGGQKRGEKKRRTCTLAVWRHLYRLFLRPCQPSDSDRQPPHRASPPAYRLAATTLARVDGHPCAIGHFLVKHLQRCQVRVSDLVRSLRFTFLKKKTIRPPRCCKFHIK